MKLFQNLYKKDISPASGLVFERKLVKAAISEKGVYQAEGVQLKLLEADEEEQGDIKKEHFVGTVSSGNTFFSGTLNWKFQRDGYSFNKYSNGDQYLGCFTDDERTKHGFYLWKPKIEGGTVSADFYHGFWDANLKSSHGIYLWIEEPENNKEFDNANFEAFVGTLAQDELKRGSYLIKNNDCYYVYFGNFTTNGKKNDDNGYFYSATQDRLFRGKIQNDIFIKGYVAYFDPDEGSLSDLVYVEFDENEQIKSVTEELDIIDDDVLNVKELMKNFRNIILDKDYFGIIYQNYKECNEFVKENCQDASIFESKNDFTKVIMICAKYNTDNITRDITSVMHI